MIVMGQVAGLFGVRGWLKIVSWTDPREGILGYPEWHLGDGKHWRAVRMAEGKRHGGGVIARLEGIDDRDAAAALIGEKVAVQRRHLPPPEAGHYYWADLEGLQVETRNGAKLGTVAGMIPTGANDVLMVSGERQRLIPFVVGDRILEVDLDAGTIQVDWDPDW